MAAPDWTVLRAQFPALKDRAYFGWASVAPLSLRAAEAMRAQLDGVLQRGVLDYRDWYGAYDACRAESARLLQAQPGEIALLKNTSEGISTVAFGLDLQPGDNVVLPRGEFPANAYPWLAQQERGVEVRRVETDALGRYTRDEIARCVDERTRCVAVSFVNFATGFRADLAGIGALCRERGCFFFVDAIQGLGVLPVDVVKMNIDGLACDGHKWLCGPEGFGMLYLRRAWHPRVKPLALGWWSAENPARYDLDDQPLAEDARRYECGTLTTVAAYGFLEALRLLHETGVEPISSRMLGLAGELAERLRQNGYPVHRAEGEGETSGIVSFEVPGHTARFVARRLEDVQVVVNPRGGRIRAAVHAWNDRQDLHHLLEDLPRP